MYLPSNAPGSHISVGGRNLQSNLSRWGASIREKEIFADAKGFLSNICPHLRPNSPQAGVCGWDVAPTWETRKKRLAPSFGSAQFRLLRPRGVWTKRKKIFVSYSVYKSVFPIEIKSFLKRKPVFQEYYHDLHISGLYFKTWIQGTTRTVPESGLKGKK